MVLDTYGNPSDHEVDLWTDGSGTVVWADYVRFEDEGIFTVFAEIPEYGLSDQDGPVLVDSSGPQIRVTTPARGAEIPASAGPVVMVTGSVVDPWTGVTSVEINGAPLGGRCANVGASWTPLRTSGAQPASRRRPIPASYM